MAVVLCNERERIPQHPGYRLKSVFSAGMTAVFEVEGSLENASGIRRKVAGGRDEAYLS